MCVSTDVICVDAIIQSEEAHMEICRALRASHAPSARLRLRIGKLDMSCLGVPRTVVLLEQLETEVIYVKRSTVWGQPAIARGCYSQTSRVRDRDSS